MFKQLFNVVSSNFMPVLSKGLLDFILAFRVY